MKTLINEIETAIFSESYVINALREQFFTDENIEQIADDMVKHVSALQKGNNEERERLTKQKALLQQKMDRTFDFALDGLMDKATLITQSDRIKADMDVVDIKLSELQGDDNGWVDRAKVLAYLNHSKDTLNEEDPAIQRRVIHSYVEKVVVGKSKVDILIILNPYPINRTGVRLVETRGIEPLSKNT